MMSTDQYLGEIRDLLRAQLSSMSSVQLERTSRGTNVTIKVFSVDALEAAQVAEAEFDRLCQKYEAAA